MNPQSNSLAPVRTLSPYTYESDPHAPRVLHRTMQNEEREREGGQIELSIALALESASLLSSGRYLSLSLAVAHYYRARTRTGGWKSDYVKRTCGPFRDIANARAREHNDTLIGLCVRLSERCDRVIGIIYTSHTYVLYILVYVYRTPPARRLLPILCYTHVHTYIITKDTQARTTYEYIH